MDNVNQNSQVPQEPTPTNLSIHYPRRPKIILFLLAILVIIIVGVGTYALGTKTSQPPVQKVVVQTSPTPTLDPTASWKTYTNGVYSLKLPNDWDTLILPDGNLMVAPKQILTEGLKKAIFGGIDGGSYLTIVIEKIEQSLIDKIYAPNPDKTFTQRQTIVSGLPATEYKITWLVDLPGVKKGDISISTIVEHKGIKYDISLNNNDELEMYRQILFTFQFSN